MTLKDNSVYTGSKWFSVEFYKVLRRTEDAVGIGMAAGKQL